MSAQVRRRHYLIDKDFQLKFILRFCAVVVLASLLLGGLVFYLTRSSTTVAIENTRVSVKSTADFIFPVLVLTVVLVALFSSVVLGTMALVVSHRIVGPLYRLRREVAALQAGDFTRQFQVRNKDSLKDLAKSLALMSQALRQKHDQLRKKSEELKGFLQQRNYTVSFEDKDTFSGLLRDVDDILRYFKV
ncbi:MAG: methyl-accepting chemotaxis protein [Candidatus Omnitrophica bacterium]|nr:methyl-accepting chemotaxis protein [Candidatus Omnitrophota bacterium]